MEIEVDEWIVNELASIVELHKQYGANNPMKNVPDLVRFILSSVVEGFENPESREHVLLEILGIVGLQGGKKTKGLRRCEIKREITDAETQMSYHFWKAYKTLVDRLGEDVVNFSSDHDFIAVNITHFIELCRENNLRSFPVRVLGSALQKTMKPKLIETNRSTWSSHFGKNFKCYIFKK